MYQEILSLVNNLDIIQENINTYLMHNFIRNSEPLENIDDIKKHLSFLFAKVTNHNDINKLAIKFNPQNEAPYLNIIDDLVIYNNYSQALEFYNNEYLNYFPENTEINSIIDLCWFLSDKYSTIGEYYNAVERQKKL